MAAAATLAAVIGQLVLAGGPRGHAPVPARGWPIRVEQAGRVRASLRTGARGGFRLSLPAGSYELVAQQPFAPHHDCAARALVLRRGADVHVQLSCAIK